MAEMSIDVDGRQLRSLWEVVLSYVLGADLNFWHTEWEDCEAWCWARKAELEGELEVPVVGFGGRVLGWLTIFFIHHYLRFEGIAH